MLGRLKMTIDECIKKYKASMTKVFNANSLEKYARFAAKGQFHDAVVLEGVIKDLIQERLGKNDVDLLDEADSCKMYRLQSEPPSLPCVRQPMY